ncbi:phosphatase PAP2 family protein [Cyanobium sp. Morenito 9A2]|nr:phosphatase PAP2 family protein [Cyanobium sp. Morenito 9A2]
MRMFGLWRLLACLVALALLLVIELTVVPLEHPPLDSALLSWLGLVIPDGMGRVLIRVYKVSGIQFTGVLVMASLIYLAWKRWWNELRWLAVGTAGILLIVDRWLKPHFDRQRPDEKLVEVFGRSFPSGHAAGAVVFYFLMCSILVARYPQLRRPLYLGSALWVALIWLSTLYCRVHWPSDIVGGACVGFIWLSICAISLRFCATRQTGPSPEGSP